MNAAPQRPNWYVARTHTHAEKKAAFNLERQGYGVYLPCYLKQRRHARRVETVAAPLFPRYLFVAIDLTAQRWRSVLSTFGVAQLLSGREGPEPVAAGLVEGLKASEDDQGFVGLPAPAPFGRGEKVRLLDGAFAAQIGLFEGLSDRDRVAVLFDILGRKVRVFVDPGVLAAA